MDKIAAIFYKNNEVIYTTSVLYNKIIYGEKAVEISRILAITELMFNGLAADKLVIGETTINMALN